MIKTKYKFLYVFFAIIILFSSFLITSCGKNDNSQPSTDDTTPKIQTFNVVGLGDSISAGYAVTGSDMYNSYMAYVNGETKINQMCFTNLIASAYADTKENVSVTSYAKSGDKSSDLVAKFNDGNNYPNLGTDVNNADIITLCIGANNVLGTLLNGGTSSSLVSYIMGITTLEAIDTKLQAGLQQFKTDYTNSIMPRLTQSNAKVYVMTIYDPFKYFDISEIRYNSSDTMTNNIANLIITKFPDIKSLAINYLNEVNNYIRNNSNYENVVVVDVNATFEAIDSATTYSKYINADSSKIDLGTVTYSSIGSIANNIYLDPHPTSLGQKFIANIYLQAMDLPTIDIE